MAINEERSYTEYNVTTPTTDFVVGFDFLDDGTDIVEVTLNDVDPTTIGYTVLQVNNTTYRFAPPVPTGVVRLTRVTDIDQMAHVFTEGAIFVSENMDGNFKQIRHSQQEVRDRQDKLEGAATALLLEVNDVKVIAEQAALDANEALDKVDDILNTGVVPASMILTSNGGNQQQFNDTQEEINLYGGKKYDMPVGGYPVGAKVLLDDNTTEVVSTIANNTANPNTARTGWRLSVVDSSIETWSGRTQESKNKDTVSALDFGIIPNSLDDQTSKFDNFFNYLRDNKVKGTAPAGTYIVSPTKQKVFGTAGESNLETVNYCIDVSGVEFEGALAGYRNAQGTIFKINPLSTDTKAVVMLQAQQTASLIMYSVKGVAFRNAPVCLRMTYAVHCNIDHVYADNTCKDFIILGEFSFASGALFNKFSNINCAVLGKPLQMQGKSWCNANIFENFYLSGGEPSSIVVTGGYGAIANTFIGGEFASTANGSHGIVLGRVAATSFYGTYFEPQGHAIVFDGLSRSTLLSNCTYGTTNSSKTEGVNPSVLHHRGLFNAEVIIDGGVLFFDASNPLQSNMTMLSTANASQVALHVPKQLVLGGGDPSYKLITPDVLRSLRVFRGYYSDSRSLEFSGAGASITNLPSTSRMDVNISGSVCTVNFRIDMSDTATYGDGIYYLRLPRTNPSTVTTLSSVGTLIAYDVLGISEQMMGYIRATASGNLDLSVLKPSAASVYDDATKTVTTTIRNQRVDVDRTFLQSLGNNGYIQGSLTYTI